MKHRNFKLGFGCLGNGVTVWNSLREVRGDYEKVAHISDNGEIKWYVKDLPREERQQVEAQAESHAAFRNAIRTNVLNEAYPDAANYSGNYMYMGKNHEGKAQFKHKETRQYLKY